MVLELASLRNFRNYERAAIELAPGLNVLHGSNGAGKTNVLEAIYFGCTGRSCRTNTDSHVIKFKETVARVELEGLAEGGRHKIEVGIERGSRKAFSIDGVPVERLEDSELRPMVAVFMPDRLELVKGAPGVRRAHIDALLSALWPARREARRRYAQALAQRNALLARRAASDTELDAWDRELATTGVELTAGRRLATATVAEAVDSHAVDLGLDSGLRFLYKPNSDAIETAELLAQLLEHRDRDRQRGFTTVGPHRDDAKFVSGDVDLKPYGSQGQQRVALLALLLAERDAIAEVRGRSPLTLLDDVMSELDVDRRERLLQTVAGAGQSVITTTEMEHIPNTDVVDRAMRVRGGAVEMTERV